MDASSDEAPAGPGGGPPATVMAAPVGESADPRLSGWDAGGGFRLAPAHAEALQGAELPSGVTPALVREGGAVFHGEGGCHVCHGEAATGARGVGADLTDGEWWHTDGSWEGIAARARSGVPQDSVRNGWGAMMPPRGGSSITDDQLRAVAAYVWSLRLFDPPPGSPEDPPPG